MVRLVRKVEVAALTIIVAAAFGALVAQARVSISVWQPWGGETGASFRRVVDAFNKAQATVKATTVTASDPIGQPKLMAAMAAGSPPDVALFADLLVAEFAQKKLLAPLDTYAKLSGLTAKNFWRAAWGVSFYEGKQWALPLTEDCRGLYYNKTILREIGYDPAAFPKTLEELEELAAKMFRLDGLKYSRVGYVPWGGNWYFYGWGWLFGADFWDAGTKKVTANSPKNVEALDWLRKYAQKFDIARIRRSPQDFYRGSLGMVNDGNWLIGLIKSGAPKSFDYGIAPVPPPRGRGISTWSGVWTMVIPRGAKHPKESWEFMKFASGPVGQAILAKENAFIPANIQVTRDLTGELAKMFGEGFRDFVELMDSSHHRPTIPVGGFLWDKLDAAMLEVLDNKKSPQQALDAANVAVQKELDKVLERTKTRK